MLLRIALVIAILAGIGVAVLNFVQIKEKVTVVMTDRDTFHKERDDERSAHTKTKKQLADTTADRDKTKRKLAETTTERDTAQAEAEKQRKETEKLTAGLRDMTDKFTSADQKLSAYKAAGLEPEQITALNATNKLLLTMQADLQRVQGTLERELHSTRVELAKFKEDDYSVPLPSGLTAKVLAVDPRYGFVVLDKGQKDGALKDGRMLLSRSGKLVARIRLMQVEPDRCVANILPGWDVNRVIEGDVAVTQQ